MRLSKTAANATKSINNGAFLSAEQNNHELMEQDTIHITYAG